ncbi:hypothetical protein ElyMa_005936400 [Elysia marginata]|uniref:MATH domain-containing protein n=1 Tax=Elysia marginata TaxID=1093978 RepID=A0AAV4GA01_9GAST|nr:hypothetical protein ElyMa_005936400 [Elysia marginata]
MTSDGKSQRLAHTTSDVHHQDCPLSIKPESQVKTGGLDWTMSITGYHGDDYVVVVEEDDDDEEEKEEDHNDEDDYDDDDDDDADMK